MSHKSIFQNPPRAFTTLPFWFWNDELNKKEIKRQIHDFNNKGVHGFIIHPRKGLPRTIEYMSDTYMDFVEFAVQEANSLDMQVILYDEAQYPSGSAHGAVVRNNPNHASRGLRRDIYTTDKAMMDYELQPGERIVSRQRRGDAYFVFVECFSEGTVRGIHEEEDDHEKYAPKAADLLNKDATLSFINETHQKYYDRLKTYFGTTIIGMFTDEPKILGRCHIKGLIPWTDDLLAKLLEKGFKEDELNDLFEGNHELYESVVYDLMAERYYKPLYDWCEDHGIALTGHPEASDDIGLLKYFHIPGQDVVWRWIAPETSGIEGVHSTMAKCSSDSARHRGRSRNANEVLGCCGPNDIQWALTMDDFKWYMDYLFIREVNMIYLHAFYYSVRTALQHEERPPDVGPNNVWWEDFNEMSDYIKRMSWLLTDSVNQARVAVITKHQNLPHEEVKGFYQNQILFNYLEEELLDQARIEDGKIYIENQAYDQVYVYEASDKSRELLKNIKHIEAPKSNGRYPNLRYNHIVKEETAYHLFCNEGDDSIHVEFDLGIENAEIWHPWTGVIEGIESSNGKVTYELERRQLVIITEGNTECTKKQNIVYQPLNCKWKLSLADNDYDLNELVCWTNFNKNYSGEATYTTNFEWHKGHASLDLGDVSQIATLYVNEVKVATKMWAPYKFDISEYLIDGMNNLRVTIKNTMANNYGNSMKSGLFGPIKIGKYN